MEVLFQIFGWVGAFILLLAFYLNSRSILVTKDKRYQWMNCIGGSLLVLNAYYFSAYPFIVVNLFWAIVALVSIFKPSPKAY